jgi:hypothetical protein
MDLSAGRPVAIFGLPVSARLCQLAHLLSMKRIPTAVFAAVVLASCGGCSLLPSHIPFIGRKKPSPQSQNPNHPPKPPKDIANSVEREFMARWIDKRVGELVSQGQPADAAREQATTEFKQKFAATTVAQKLP